jgi:hypothetical protein
MKVRIKPEEFDKYREYAVDFHGNRSHTEEEVDPEESTLDDWHNKTQGQATWILL